MRLKNPLIGCLALASAMTPLAVRAQSPLEYFQHPAASSLTGSEIIGPVRQGGADVTVTTGMLSTFVGGQISTSGGSATITAAGLNNQTPLVPLTTIVGTSPTTIFAAQSGGFKSLVISPAVAGASVACTGDGSTPVLGTSPTAVYGQSISWPAQIGAQTPTNPVKCTASVVTTISVGAY